jgi:transcriptional regulator with XRE-family HTH domain
MTDHSADANAIFADSVNRLRSSRGWSLRELADRSQLDVPEIESILGGEDEVPLDAIILLARAFGVSPGELVEGTAGRSGRD